MKIPFAALLLASLAFAAPSDRIRRPIDASATRIVKGNLNRQARPEADRGPVDPGMRLDHVVLAFRPSPDQQAELDQLLIDQQNPNSPRYLQWLSPEEFAGRFGLTPTDESKVVAWLKSEGLDVKQQARGRNWLAFSGTARQVNRALHTDIRHFATDRGDRFANSTEPSVPEALEDVVAGFSGLDDFLPESQARQVPGPLYNSGTAHYLVPEDLATIYNITPLYKAGFDGTGQGIVVVGQSAVDITDLRAFKTRHNLPANDPKFVLYSGVDPGFTSSELEGVLDLEWAGAIAPKATISYVYGTNAFSAMIYAINLNIAPIISVSYGGCEFNYSPSAYRSIAQQANAQGITILVASGDSGAASCDRQGIAQLASKGMNPAFPAIMPEVTAVGGTQFDEGTGRYWAASNSANLGSALSYIPEKAWNESGANGLLSTGGGISRIYPKPSWQIGTGITDSNFRHYPDISLSAAGHDAYIITYAGSLAAISGTSASAPSMAGIVALLNQAQVANGSLSRPGLGNINPQLYRLAQSAPTAFHDIAAGDNIVPCSQGSPDCLTGSYGYAAVPGYDLATGLGSIDANNLVANWNSKTKVVSVNLVVSTTRLSLNDSVNVTALISSPTGGTPTGTVEFSIGGTLPLGSVPLIARGTAQAADLTIPAYLVQNSGTFLLVANYSGDAAFSGGGATRAITITIPTGAAGIVVSAPTTVWPVLGPDTLGLSWQTTLTLRELAGTAAMLTGFAIDGQDQTLSKYFPTTSITAGGTLAGTVIFRGLSTPTSHSFTFTGIDAAGNSWTRNSTVLYMPLFAGTDFQTSVTPLVINQNTADPACPWPIRVNVEDWGGSQASITGLWVGTVNYTSQIVPIFGTERLDAWSSLQGAICISGVTPPVSTQTVEVDLSTGQYSQMQVSFAGPPANPATLSATPAAVTLEARDPGRFAQATLALGLTDRNAEWTVTMLPGNRTTGWLTVSPLSGKGPGALTLTARGQGFMNGAYRALLVIQSTSAMPQTLTVPVMLVMGPNSSGITITSALNGGNFQDTAAPGGIVSVFGSQLAETTNLASGSPISFANSGVSATVNGLAAPVVYASPTQLNIQVPYEAGAGPAVIGINSNGQIAGALFQIAPSAPGIFTVSPATAKAGAQVTAYVTGVGEVLPTLKTAYAPSTAVSGQAKPVLPVSVTVGGVPAFVQIAALSPNRIGTAQITFTIPAETAAGPQPVVVTVGKASSPAATITVQ